VGSEAASASHEEVSLGWVWQVDNRMAIPTQCFIAEERQSTPLLLYLFLLCDSKASSHGL